MSKIDADDLLLECYELLKHRSEYDEINFDAELRLLENRIGAYIQYGKVDHEQD